MSEQKGGLAQGANGQLVALENVIYHLEDIETDVHGNLPWTQVANAIEHIKLCAEPRTPAEGESVAWISFADNGNIRLWTADERRAKDEKARGLDMRSFTLAELIALVSRLGHAEAQVEEQTVCLERIAVSCTANMDRNKDHRRALEAIRQTANDMLDGLSHTSTNRQSTEG